MNKRQAHNDLTKLVNAIRNGEPLSMDLYMTSMRVHDYISESQLTCPYIVTSDEGTSYCRLAEDNSR